MRVKDKPSKKHKNKPLNLQTSVVPAGLQRRRLHVQRADPTRWLQRLRVHQTRSLAESGQPSAEADGSGPGHAVARTVPPSDKYTGADVARRKPRVLPTSADFRAERPTAGFSGIVGDALADDPQPQLPQKMTRLLSVALTGCDMGQIYADSR